MLSGIHIGDNTHTQLQSIRLHSFNTRNTTCSIPKRSPSINTEFFIIICSPGRTRTGTVTADHWIFVPL